MKERLSKGEQSRLKNDIRRRMESIPDQDFRTTESAYIALIKETTNLMRDYLNIRHEDMYLLSDNAFVEFIGEYVESRGERELETRYAGFIRDLAKGETILDPSDKELYKNFRQSEVHIKWKKFIDETEGGLDRIKKELYEDGLKLKAFMEVREIEPEKIVGRKITVEDSDPLARCYLAQCHCLAHSYISMVDDLFSERFTGWLEFVKEKYNDCDNLESRLLENIKEFKEERKWKE